MFDDVGYRNVTFLGSLNAYFVEMRTDFEM